MVVDAGRLAAHLRDAPDRLGPRGGALGIPLHSKAPVRGQSLVVGTPVGLGKFPPEPAGLRRTPGARPLGSHRLLRRWRAAPSSRAAELVVVQRLRAALHDDDSVGQMLGFDDGQGAQHPRRAGVVVLPRRVPSPAVLGKAEVAVQRAELAYRFGDGQGHDLDAVAACR